MFAKLFKYEMKATSRIFLIAWPALLILALLNGLLMNTNAFWYQPFSTAIVQVVTMIAFIMLFAAVVVMTMLVIIMRFYKGLLKEEGYLMFTLPVTTRQMITAKGLSATVIAVASVIVGSMALAALAMPSLSPHEIGEVLIELPRALARIDGWYIYLTEIIIMGIVGTMATIYQVYAAMSIGQLAQKHRVAWSFAAYVGISILLSIIVWVFGVTFPIAETDIYTYISTNLRRGELSTHFIIIAYTVVQIIKVFAFHIVCEYILSKKLNLE